MADIPIVPKEPTVVEPKTGDKPVIKIEPPQKIYETEKKIVREKQIIWYVWLIIEVILFCRFLLKLFGANPTSLFSIIITILSTPFTFLFTGLFSPIIVPVGHIVIEWSTLFAMLIYTLIAWVMTVFFRLKKPIYPQEAERKVNQEPPDI